MAVELGNLAHVCSVNVSAEHIHRAGAFFEVIKALAVGCPAGIAVLALEIGEFTESTFLVVGLSEPDVARNGRRVVLAPLVLIAFHVLEQ